MQRPILTIAARVRRVAALSTILAFTALGFLPAPAVAHEVTPAIADLTAEPGMLRLDIRLNAEALVAGVDLDGLEDTNASDLSGTYDALRAEPPEVMEQAFRAAWPDIAAGLTLRAGGQALAPELIAVQVPPVGNADLPRATGVTVNAALPDGATSVEIGWIAAFGNLVVRQQGVGEGAYTGYLTGGEISPPIPLAGGGGATLWQTVTDYIVIGFEHIIPKGLDHILFVLGLFFLSLRLRPLLIQVTAFTAAHTVTLALGILGIVNIPASIVEPLIALSIVYVAVENIISPEMSRWRPIVVVAFGLLHGLGFASVLGEIGLDPAHFVAGLIAFNVGVELGQLTVIALAFLALGLWFGRKNWYRSAIAVPASVAIAAVGAWWSFERVFL